MIIHPFLDSIKKAKNIKTDASLAIKLGISSPTISKVRRRKISCGDTLLLKAHIFTNISIKELKQLIKESNDGATV